MLPIIPLTKQDRMSTPIPRDRPANDGGGVAPLFSISGAVEDGDDLLRRARELAERPNKWVSPIDPHVRERYLDSDLNVVVRIGRLARQRVAVVKRLLPHEFIQIGRERPELVDAEAVGRRIGLHQRPVLAGNVQVVDGPEKHWNIPSVVWLETFDSRLMSSRKPFYFFSSSAFKVGGAIANREVDIFFSDLAISLGEFVGEQIECAAQAVNDDTSLRVDDTRDWFDLSEFPSLFTRLRIFLTNGGVWATLTPSGNSALEDVELGFGPLNAN